LRENMFRVIRRDSHNYNDKTDKYSNVVQKTIFQQ